MAVDALQAACSSGKVDIGRAIDRCCERFPLIEGTKDCLTKWTETESFWSLFEEIQSGQRTHDSDRVVRSFMAATGFWMPETGDAEEAAEEIIRTFLQALLDEIYGSKDGLSTFARRFEVSRSEDRAERAEILSAIRATEVGGGGVEAHLTAQTMSGGAQPETGPKYADVRSRLDSLRELIDLGQVSKPKAELHELLKDESFPASVEFRIHTNLGACALVEGDESEARVRFELAYLLEPDDPKAMANHALGHLFRGKLKAATSLTKAALARTPENSYAAAVIIEALFESGDNEQLRQFTDAHPWIANARQSSLVLADVRRRQESFEGAASLCRSRLEADPEDFGAHLLLSRCLLEEGLAGFAQGGPITESADKRIEEAESAATRAIELLEHSERKVQLSAALTIRAFVRGLMARYDDALEDLAFARRATPSNPSVNRTLGLVSMSAGRFEDARDAFLLVQEEDPSADVLAPLAEAVFRIGDDHSAAALVRGQFSFDQPSPDALWKAELVCRAELASGEEHPCWATFEAALAGRPHDPWLLAISAIRFQANEKLDQAESAFKEAIVLSVPSQEADLRFRLGRLYERMSRFSEAADVYVELIGSSAHHPVAINLFECLAHAKRFREALSWARALRKALTDPPKHVLDAEAQILEIAGDVQRALPLREEICSRDDASATDQVHMAFCQFRAGKRIQAATTAKSIVAEDVATDPQSLLRLANLKRVLQIPEWLEDAYLARRVGHDVPEMHLGLFGALMGGELEVMEPVVVEAGTAVQLRNIRTEDTGWWQILDDGDETAGARELKPTDDLALLLIGRSVGDSVVLRQDWEDLEYEVVSIQSKYTRALQETTEEFSTRFPHHRGLSRVPIPEDDPSKLIQLAARDFKHTSDAIEAYCDAGLPLPLATLASFLQRSVLEVWEACTTDGDIAIRFSSGDADEARHAAECLTESKGIVLDLVALAAAYKLGFGEHLRSRFARVAVPQHVIDELQDVHSKAAVFRPQGRLGITEHGALFLAEHSKEQAEEWLDYTGKLLSFAESFARIPSYRMLDDDYSEPLMEMITAQGVGTIYSDDRIDGDPLVLVSDDLGLATIAQAMGRKVANSQDLLAELRRTGHIPADDYSASIEQLASMHYSFVSVESGDIVQRLRQNGYMSSEGIRAMLRGLRAPECSDESAIRVAAQVLVELADDVPLARLSLILELLMAEIRVGRDSQQVLEQLRQMLATSRKMLLMPWVSKALMSSIEAHTRLAPPAWHVGDL